MADRGLRPTKSEPGAKDVLPGYSRIQKIRREEAKVDYPVPMGPIQQIPRRPVAKKETPKREPVKTMPKPQPSYKLEEQKPAEYSAGQLKKELDRLGSNEPPEMPTTISALAKGRVFADMDEAMKVRHFEVLYDKLLGKGGFGSVFSGRMLVMKGQEVVDRKVCAIKVVKVRRSDEDSGTRFTEVAKEAVYWQHCNFNPYVIMLVDHFAAGEHYVFIMQLAEMDFLTFQRKDPGERLEPIKARYYFKQMVQAVNYLHARGIAHRDIKLENFLLVKDPKDKDKYLCKINDFGLATIGWTPTRGMIYGYHTAGTLPYMAPESHYLRVGVPKAYKKMPPKDPSMTGPTSKPEVDIKPNIALRLMGAKTERPISVRQMKLLALHRDYTWAKKGYIYPLPCDNFALGILLFVMISGTYPYWTRDLPRGLDFILRAKIPKLRSMPQMVREFVRMMLEPIPSKRANTRDILDHDWMRDQPFSRRKRTSKEGDFDLVPTPPPSPDVSSSGSSGGTRDTAAERAEAGKYAAAFEKGAKRVEKRIQKDAERQARRREAELLMMQQF